MQSWTQPQDNQGQSQSTSVFTNLYEIRIDRLPSKLWLYIPQPSHQNQTYDYTAHHQHHRNDPNHFYTAIGYLCRYKKGFLGTNQVEDALHICSITVIDDKDQKEVIDVPLSAAKEVSLQAIVRENNGRAALQALIDPALKRNIQKKAVHQKTVSFDNFEFKTSTHNILKLTRFNSKFWLTTDTLVKVHQNCTLLHYLLKYSHSEAQQLLKNAKVMKTYGNWQSYFISEIDYKQNPTALLPQSKETYEEYYKRKYQIQITNLTQPLIIARDRLNSRETSIVLIPELIAIQDRSRRPDYPPELDWKIEKLKRVIPSQKESLVSETISSLAAQDIIKKSALKIEAVKLSNPTLALNTSEIEPQEGVFQFRNKIMYSPELRSWAVAYSLKDQSQDKTQINELISYFRNLTRVFGVNILSNPSEIPIPDPKLSSWKSTLEDNFKKFGKLQAIMILLKQDEQALYHQLKEFLTLKLQCVSQVIKKSTLFGPNCKKPYAIATDIMIQMITKVGATPWNVLQKKTQLTSSLIMQAGFLLEEQKGHFSCWFLGFTNKDANQVHSAFKTKIQKREDLRNALGSVFLGGWAKKFVINHRQPPQTIILFRGCSGPVAEEQKQWQRDVLKMVVGKIGQKMSKSGYLPTILYIEVSKQKQIQVYSREEEASSSITLKNVECGTVIFEDSPDTRQFVFYLKANEEMNTTVKPVSFRVTSNNDKYSKEDIVQFVYEQCYNYYNYHGSMAMPSALQYAHKLKATVSHFKNDNEPNQLSSNLYFL